MMMNPNEYDIQKLRRAELLEQAEQNRATVAVPNEASDNPFYATTLTQLGEVMVAVGTDLKNRYGQMDTCTLPTQNPKASVN